MSRFNIGDVLQLKARTRDFAVPDGTKAVVTALPYSGYVHIAWGDKRQRDGHYNHDDFELYKPLTMAEQITRKFLDDEYNGI